MLRHCRFHCGAIVVGLLIPLVSAAQGPETDVTSSVPFPTQTQQTTQEAGTSSSSSAADAPQLGPGQSALSGSNNRAGPNHPAYKVLRYDEDFSYLRDPAKQTDFWDPLKFIPFGESNDHFITLGGEVREWFESYHNDGFGAGPANAAGYNTYFLQRYMLHSDIHLGSNWRVFLQSISGSEEGRIGGPRPDIDNNTFDIHQGFVDWIWSGDESNNLTWRIGRQEFRYGSGRLIDVREGPNLRRSFDAIRALAKVGDWSIDAWWSKPVENNPNIFDDIPDPSVSFWGLYGTGPVAADNRLSLDLYYLGFHNQDGMFNQKSGDELRHSVGTRVWGRPMPWEYNLEYVYQFGQFGSGRISAWTAANAVRYNFSDAPLKPAVGIRFDVASGDQNAQSANLQTFNPLFPSGAYFNLAGPFGPLNIIDLHPTLDLTLSETWKLSADWNFFWRESLQDGVYRLSGSEIASGQASNARYIGSSPSITAVWTPQPHVTVLISYVHVFPGQFLTDATPGQPLDFVTGWLTYKF
ncbi:alginate export family protein [Schlesneria paludicola]|uniref:alginate export family protein n=1 Tax=Schlesneria paludicola TaxID=360056 RepID=UPI00029B0FDF|nr:alginate export family protein [Schlesneria paludicola]